MKYLILLLALSLPLAAQQTLTNSNLDGVSAATIAATIAEGPAAARNAIGDRHAIYATDPAYAGGARFDGKTDDTAAIQAALDAMAADEAISVVRMPAGRAIINGALILKIPGSLTGHRRVALVGAGAETTIIEQTSTSADGIQFQLNNVTGNDYAEFVGLKGFTVEGPGLATSTGRGIDTHDDRYFDEHFNGGTLSIEDIKVGNNGKGFETGLYLKRWDTSSVRDCRFMYNYRNVYCEAFTKTVTFQGCANTQAESVLWDVGQSAKITLVGCDNGNAPQWYHLANGSSVSVIGSNHETQRFSTTAARKYNYATTTFPGTATVTSANTGTGLVTTSANHGFKPGAFVHFSYSTIPALNSPQNITEQYKVLADSFTATTFKVAAVPRAAAVAGTSLITIFPSAQRSTNYDLNVGGKVYITTGNVKLESFASGEFWIISKPSTTTLEVSLTEGGAAVTFPGTGNIFLRSISPLIFAASGVITTVACPSIAVELGATFNTVDSQYTGDGSGTCTAPMAAVGNGGFFYSNGVWHTAGYTGTYGGRVLMIGSNVRIVGHGIPMTQKSSTDAAAVANLTMLPVYEPNSSSYAANAARRGQLLFKMATPGSVTWDEAFILGVDRAGTQVPIPITNQSARLSTPIAALTTELKTNTRYRVLWGAASGDIVCHLPDHVASGEILSYDDEITIHAMNTNGHPVKITQAGSGTITYGPALVPTGGNTHGISIVQGESVTLKCVSVTGSDKGLWQVVSQIGTPVAF